jgi:ribosomal protein L24E
VKVLTIEDIKKTEKDEDAECDYCGRPFRTEKTAPTHIIVAGAAALVLSFCSEKCRDTLLKKQKCAIDTFEFTAQEFAPTLTANSQSS